MSTTDQPVSILADCLKEICESTRPPEALRRISIDSLQELDPDVFPPPLQATYEELRNQLRDYRRDHARLPGNGEGVPGDSGDQNPGPLIEDLIQLYGLVQTHRAPVIERDWFLDQIDSATEEPVSNDDESEDTPGRSGDFTSLFLRVE